MHLEIQKMRSLFFERIKSSGVAKLPSPFGEGLGAGPSHPAGRGGENTNLKE